MRYQGTGGLTEQPKNRLDDRLVAEETRSDFVAVTEIEGDVTRGKTVGSVMATKTFDAVDDDSDDMPLPTDPKTVFLGGLFALACMAVLYVAAEIVLPLILAIVLKLLLQPFVRLLERIHIPRAVGAILSVLLVLLAFGGTISMLAGPAADWAGKLPDAIPKLRDSLSFLHAPIEAGERMMKQIPGFGSEPGAAPQAPAVKNLLGAVLSGSASADLGPVHHTADFVLPAGVRGNLPPTHGRDPAAVQGQASGGRTVPAHRTRRFGLSADRLLHQRACGRRHRLRYVAVRRCEPGVVGRGRVRVELCADPGRHGRHGDLPDGERCVARRFLVGAAAGRLVFRHSHYRRASSPLRCCSPDASPSTRSR